MSKVLISTENMPYKDWLEYRKKGIGGSDVSVVCGINKYKSPVELWLEKTGQLPYSEAGEAAYWGTQLEALVRTEFTKRTGIEVSKVNQILQHDDYPFMLANLDGTCQHPNYLFENIRLLSRPQIFLNLKGIIFLARCSYQRRR